MKDNAGSQVKVYTPDEQMNLLRAHSRKGVWRSMSLLHRKHVEIEELMLQRTMTLGLEQYGDVMFHQTRHALDRESMEEAADMVAREAVYDMIENGVIVEGTGQ